jgi:nitroreductase
MTEIIDFLLTRRSVTARNMVEPGPSDEQLDMILRAAHRVPDHGKLGPWRFIILRGDARAEFGEILGAAFQKENPDAFEELIEVERERFQRAPVVVTVTSRITPEHKIPEWEQTLSSGAACMNMLNAAHAIGFAAQWITEWPAYNSDVADALGVGDNERIAGFVYIGTAAEPPEERRRPDIGDIVTEWKPPA